MTDPSPCVKRCVLDGAGAQCLACGRTLAEIAAWSRFDEKERRRIMASLPARLGALSPVRDTEPKP